jgi:hypothetical protein
VLPKCEVLVHLVVVVECLVVVVVVRTLHGHVVHPDGVGQSGVVVVAPQPELVVRELQADALWNVHKS